MRHEHTTPGSPARPLNPPCAIICSTLTCGSTIAGPGKENERAAVLALIDCNGAKSRLMLLIRGSNSFAYRGLYAVDVRFPAWTSLTP